MADPNNSENEITEAAFAPADPTDGRGPGDWKSRFPPEAGKMIKKEAIYLGIILVIIPIILLTNYSNFFGYFVIPPTIKKYVFVWVGGTLGGTLFSLKWLYHTVAKFVWNADRWLWRFFTPHISGGVSFAFIVLISSGLINIFSPEAMNKSTAVLGLSFLIGYFSDSAIAKLNEIANTIFGETRKGKGKRKIRKTDS